MVYILIKLALTYHKKDEFHKVYEHHMRMLEKNGGKLIGIWDVEMGPCSELILIWAVEDLNAYEKVLQRMLEDPEDKEFKEIGRPIVIDCQRWLLRPTPYSPLK